MRKTLREADLLIRFGGEEFLALLIDADAEGGMISGERIRKAMEEHSFKTPKGPLTKTMSLGLSVYPNDNDDFWECAKLADIALYHAKDTGRNQVIRYQDGMTSEE